MIGLGESSFNMTRAGGGGGGRMKILRKGSENFKAPERGALNK